MTTLLAHIRIKPGAEPQWEAIMADMAHQTWSTETGVKRYEYWKGEEPNLYYCLLSFVSKEAFYRHQCIAVLDFTVENGDPKTVHNVSEQASTISPV